MEPPQRRAALRRVAAWGPHAAVVFGSGLAALPHGAERDEVISFEDLGWPCTTVPGHRNRLELVRLPLRGGAELRLALSCGRPHLYEGWSREELERPVRTLAAAGVRRVLLTNSCGGLAPWAATGTAVACTSVVALQAAPHGERPDELTVCDTAAAERLATALAGPGADALTGTYVAVAGPQFETPAEARWLAGFGDVVGMSAAPELAAAGEEGVSSALAGLVVNRAAEVGSHDEVLAAGGRLAGVLAARLAYCVVARWPELAR